MWNTKIRDKTLGDIKIKGVSGEEETLKNNEKKRPVTQGRKVFQK